MEERPSRDSQERPSTQHYMDDNRPSYATESVLTAVEERPQDKNASTHRWRPRNRDKNAKGLLHRFAKVCHIQKTGTTSLRLALSKLGYRTYHGLELVKNGKRDMDLLHEALNLKANNSDEQYGQPEFDQIWGKYDALIDLPAFAFVPELLTLYPESVKFILTDRNVDAWLQSMQTTIFAHLSSRPFFFQAQQPRSHRRLMRKWAQIFCNLDFNAGARRAYIEHVRYCLKVVPKERLLILKVNEGTEDGREDWWDDIYEFLGKEVPNEGFPRVETIEVFERMEEFGGSWRDREPSGTYIVLSAAVAAILVGVLWCQVMRR